MKLFSNLVTLAVFLVGTYQAVSIVDGNAIVNLGGNPIKFEMKVALPFQGGTSANDIPDKQDKSILITPNPDAKSTGSSLSPRY
jgi:hypothetical protein